jgi:hypothetical protein
MKVTKPTTREYHDEQKFTIITQTEGEIRIGDEVSIKRLIAALQQFQEVGPDFKVYAYEGDHEEIVLCIYKSSTRAMSAADKKRLKEEQAAKAKRWAESAERIAKVRERSLQARIAVQTEKDIEQAINP